MGVHPPYIASSAEHRNEDEKAKGDDVTRHFALLFLLVLETMGRWRHDGAGWWQVGLEWGRASWLEPAPVLRAMGLALWAALAVRRLRSATVYDSWDSKSSSVHLPVGCNEDS